jgi:hypothetical protein
VPQAANDYQAVYDYLRMAYYRPDTADWDGVGLKAIAVKAYASGTREVTITGTASEAGGSATATYSFDPKVLLQAVMDLLAEVAPNLVPPDRPSGTLVNFGSRFIGS